MYYYVLDGDTFKSIASADVDVVTKSKGQLLLLCKTSFLVVENV